jgi:hypothetical protein
MEIRSNIAAAKELASSYFRAGLVPMLTGSPGLGKSAIMRALAEEYNLKLIDIRLAQCDPTDLNGFPTFNDDKTRSSYVPMDTFPLAGDDLPTEIRVDGNGKEYVHQFDGWLIFFDEITSADRAIQKASYKIILDRQVGTYDIHPRALMAAAGNRDTDGALVEEMSTALQSRLVHINVVSDAESWLEWAGVSGIDHRIRSYITYQPQKLNTFNPEDQGDEPTYACERTWEFVHKLLQTGVKTDGDHTLALLAGTVGEGVAREFLGYLKVFKDLPSIVEILNAPNSCTLPTAASTLYALSGTIGAHAKADNIGKLMDYVTRMPKEFQVITLREVLRTDPTLVEDTSVKQWVAKNNTQLR